MKKILLLILLLVTCINTAKLYAQKDSTHIGFILANLYSERWHKDMNYFKEKVNTLGGKVTFIDCFDNSEEQLKAAHKLIDLNVDCIVFVPINITDTAIVNASQKAKIPIICYDRFVNSQDIDLYVTFDSEGVGRKMARNVADSISEGNILFVSGPTSDFNSSLIRKGVYGELKNYKKKYNIKKVDVNDWSEISAFMTVQDYLSENLFEPDAIICSSDILASGIIYLLEEKGLLGKVLVTGQDGNLNICQQIIKGNVLMTVYKSNKILAYAAASVAMKLAKDVDMSGEYSDNFFMNIPSIKMETTVINKDNIDEIMSLLQIYSKEELYELTD